MLSERIDGFVNDIDVFVKENNYKDVIKKYRTVVDEAIKEFENEIHTLENSFHMMGNYQIDADPIKYFSVMTGLIEESCLMKEYLEKLDNLIEKKQNECEHDMKYLWHDSHYDYYECPLCGKTERN